MNVIKKRIILALCVMLTIFAGSFRAQTDSFCTFYPLNVGDLWQYRISLKLNNSSVDTIYYATKQVLGDTLMPNGYKYKVVKEESLYSNIAGDKIIRYILLDTLTAVVYEYDDGNNQARGIIIDSLKCQQGDTFGRAYLCEATGTDIILDYEKEYKNISQDLPDISNQHTIVRDIGISYQINNILLGFGGSKIFDLVYANIDGKIFGELVTSIHESKLKVV